MDAQQRRQMIAKRLEESAAPLSAASLARELNVSRQIIVGDVALLRPAGWTSPPPPGATCCPIPPPGSSVPLPAATGRTRWGRSSTPWWTRGAPCWT